MDLSAWLQGVDHLQKDFDRHLVSSRRFERALVDLLSHSDCPVAAAHIEIQPAGPFSSSTFGAPGDTAPTEMRSIPDLDSFGTVGKLTLWVKRVPPRLAPSDIIRALDSLVQLTKSFWKGDLRDTVSRIISRQNSERHQLLDNTFREAIIRHQLVALLYCDLDNFKPANDALGHQEGDRIIREFSALVTERAQPDGLVIHRSGDEFIVLHPIEFIHEALMLANRLQEDVMGHEFNSGAVRISARVGIALVPKESQESGYELTESEAESATVWNGIKQTGRTRLAVRETPRSYPPINEQSLNYSLILTKCGLLSPEPFANPWLNLLSGTIIAKDNSRALDALRISETVDGLLDWIGPAFDDSMLTSALLSGMAGGMAPVMSHMDVAFAIAHAYVTRLLSSTAADALDETLEICYNDDFTAGELRHVPRTGVMYRWGSLGDLRNKVSLGRFWKTAHTQQVREEASRRAVLIKIGHGAIKLPTKVFSEVIVVDDRPTRGGGLPDFWEATIARLIGHIESNPNASGVFIIGDQDAATNILEKLNSVNDWPSQANTLSLRTGMSAQSINMASRRLAPCVFYPANEHLLVSQLAELYRGAHELRPIAQPPLSRTQRFLSRQLDISPFSLGREDGFRAKSIAQAFPLVLEISRNADSGEAIIDQAGQQLYELVDFKVHLTAPTLDMIPAFYSDETRSLESYFETQFLSAEGLFGSVFQSTGQLAAVTNHIVTSISQANPPFHTRRAILIIPHTIRAGEDVSPVGLISVRITPRFSSGKRVLNYSFTWRTVEAVVGFPYSIYGSVRYSQYLTETIRALLTGSDARSLELGYVSYVAHSLHFFLDTYAQNIARRIVDDATA